MQLLSFIFITCLVSSISSTLGPGDKKSKTKTKQAPEAPTTTSKTVIDNLKGNSAFSVIERNLVSQNRIPASDIINYHKVYCKPCAAQKKFKNKVLGYVTPWNSKGYDVSKTFANKLDYISPVWLQIQRKGFKNYQFEGVQDIDAKWMKNVVINNKDSLFVPRILFEKLKANDLHALFNNEDELEALVKMLVDKSNEFNFGGYVLEIYSQLGGQGKTQINHLVTDIASMLHKNKKILILVIPPAFKTLEDIANADDTHAAFSKQDFYNLRDVVDGFSLMTYDYSVNSGQVGPNAPIDWIAENVKYLTDSLEYRSKIFLGLNFYGMNYNIDTQGKVLSNPEPIIGTSLIELLKKNKKVEVIFEEKIQEHLFIIKGSASQTLIFYPSLYSIHNRIQLSEELGTGISIWELGQGLDYFYDLL